MTSVFTSFLTVVTGVLVYVVGQLILKVFIEPIQDQRKTIGEIAFALVVLANVAEVDFLEASGVEVRRAVSPEEAKRTIRELAGKLRATLWTIPFYVLMARMRLARTREVVLEASAQLIGWSNSLYDKDGTGDHRKEIARLLKIE